MFFANKFKQFSYNVKVENLYHPSVSFIYFTFSNQQIPGGRSNGWSGKSVAPHKSIWSSDFKPKVLVIEKPDPCNVKRTSTSGKVVEQTVDIPQLPKRSAPSK